MALRHGGRWSELARSLDDAWLDLTFLKPVTTFREFFGGDGGIVAAPLQPGSDEDSGDDYLVASSHGDLWLELVLRRWVQDAGRTVGVVEPELVDPATDHAKPGQRPEDAIRAFNRNARRFRMRYSLKKGPQPAYTPEALATRLASMIGVLGQNQRFLLAADETWRHLWLRANISVRASPLFLLANPSMTNLVVLPFLFIGSSRRVEASPAQLDKLSLWSSSRLEHPSSVSEIRSHYSRLIKYIDEGVMGPSRHSKLWSQARSTD